MRGDWQILRWILSRVPDARGRMTPNPISLISRWKIADNLRRSLFEPSLLLLLLGGWLFLPQSPRYWTIAAVVVLAIPTYASLLFTLPSAPWKGREMVAWARGAGRSFVEGNIRALFDLIFLLHQALLSIDAIFRSLGRVFVTKRRLLEWETAAEAENAVRSTATVDIYLRWAPWVSIALALIVWKVRPSALPAAAPILFLWLVSRRGSAWLNRRPRTGRCTLREKDTQLLRNAADKIYRFFHDWSTPAINWLIPDNVSEGAEAELKLSPTNLGLLRECADCHGPSGPRAVSRVCVRNAEDPGHGSQQDQNIAGICSTGMTWSRSPRSAANSSPQLTVVIWRRACGPSHSRLSPR